MTSPIDSIARPGIHPQDISIRKKRLKETCRDFEAVMTNYMLKTMRQSIIRADQPEQARELYESMMDETLAKEISGHQSRGLAEMLYKQLEPLVEGDSRSRISKASKPSDDEASTSAIKNFGAGDKTESIDLNE